MKILGGGGDLLLLNCLGNRCIDNFLNHYSGIQTLTCRKHILMTTIFKRIIVITIDFKEELLEKLLQNICRWKLQIINLIRKMYEKLWIVDYILNNYLTKRRYDSHCDKRPYLLKSRREGVLNGENVMIHKIFFCSFRMTNKFDLEEPQTSIP